MLLVFICEVTLGVMKAAWNKMHYHHYYYYVEVNMSESEAVTSAERQTLSGEELSNQRGAETDLH